MRLYQNFSNPPQPQPICDCDRAGWGGKAASISVLTKAMHQIALVLFHFQFVHCYYCYRTHKVFHKCKHALHFKLPFFYFFKVNLKGTATDTRFALHHKQICSGFSNKRYQTSEKWSHSLSCYILSEKAQQTS